MAEISQWTAEGIGFRRVDVAVGERLAFSKVMFEEVVLLAFTGATWHSEQAGRRELETPDCVVMRDAGQVFSARLGEVLDPRGSVCRELHFSPAKLRELCEGMAFELREPVLIEPGLSRELLRVHRTFERDGATLEASSDLLRLLATIAARTRGHGARIAACSRRTQRVIDYLRAHFAEKVTLAELGQVTDSNPFVLLRQFQKQTGVSPHDYLSAYRVYRAQQYLDRGLKLSEIAHRCGFSDQSHLNRQFKRRLGVAPRALKSTSSNTRTEARAKSV
ncbi:MAG TPA: AraC family transcriptional regulator [Polyangiales bacterium]|nr:AraC family transcriptional regulator [Polyangiales bacterium]